MNLPQPWPGRIPRGLAGSTAAMRQVRCCCLHSLLLRSAPHVTGCPADLAWQVPRAARHHPALHRQVFHTGVLLAPASRPHPLHAGKVWAGLGLGWPELAPCGGSEPLPAGPRRWMRCSACSCWRQLLSPKATEHWITIASQARSGAWTGAVGLRLSGHSEHGMWPPAKLTARPRHASAGYTPLGYTPQNSASPWCGGRPNRPL